MSFGLEIILLFVVFIGQLLAGVAVPVAIGMSAILFLFTNNGLSGLNAIGLMSWASINSFALTAVPLFLLMAEILSASGLTGRVFRGMSRLVGRLPGGLVQTSIGACAIFASVSGSSVATAAALGRVALPQLTSRNYNRPIAAGALAAGGTLGVLIPPSIAMVIYGMFTQTSVPQLFMAGVVPGIILTCLFMLFVAAYDLVYGIVKTPTGMPEYTEPSDADLPGAFADIAPFFLLIIGTLGSLYLGFVTTTEAAMVGCILAIIIGRVWGSLNVTGLVAAVTHTIVFSGNILLLILSAFIFSAAMNFSGVNSYIQAFVESLQLTPFEFLLALFAIFAVAGTLVESLGMIVLLVPILFPLIQGYGIDPLVFGIIVVLFVELAQIHPPLGINLFVIQSVWDGKLSDVIIGAIPFSIIIIAMAFLVSFVPEIVLWLPNLMNQ